MKKKNQLQQYNLLLLLHIVKKDGYGKTILNLIDCL